MQEILRSAQAGNDIRTKINNQQSKIGNLESLWGSVSVAA